MGELWEDIGLSERSLTSDHFYEMSPVIKATEAENRMAIPGVGEMGMTWYDGYQHCLRGGRLRGMVTVPDPSMLESHNL